LYYYLIYNKIVMPPIAWDTKWRFSR